MKQFFIIGLFFTLTFLMGPALSADLSSNIMKRVNWANQYLDEAEGQIASGRAEFAGKNIKGAREEYGNISKYYGGSYDPAHPTLTTLQARIKTVEDNVKNGPGAAQASAGTKIEKAEGSALPADLSSNVIKRVKLANQYLDEAEGKITSGRAEFAGKNIKSAREEYGNISKYYGGSYDPAHPTLTALQGRIKTVEDNVQDALGAAQASADAKIEKAKKLAAQNATREEDEIRKVAVVLPIILQNAERLEEAYEAAKWKVRELRSAVNDGKGDRVLAGMEGVRESVERVNTLIPEARQVLTDLDRQFPENSWKELVPDSVRAGVGTERMGIDTAVAKLDYIPKNWLEQEVEGTVTLALDSAESNIKAYGTDHLAKLEGKTGAQKEYAANTSQEFVVIYSSILLEIIDVVLPELSESNKAKLPKFAAARKQALDRAAPLRTDIVKTETAVRKINKDVVDSKQRKLAAARFPPESEYHGGKWDDAEKLIRKAFKARIHDKKLVKIDIYLPWEVREEAKWRNDHWEVKTYRYIGANCLAKLSSGKYRVYRMNFRNTKLADGSWSTLEQWSVGHSYEILQENIDK